MQDNYRKYLETAKKIFEENKTLTLVSRGKDGKVWAGKVYFGEEDGYIYVALERGKNYNNIIENPNVFFVIEHGVPDRFIQGEGVAEVLGDITERPERSVIFRKAIELVVYAKKIPGVTLFRIRPTKLYISDFTEEWKPRIEIDVTDEVLKVFQTKLKTKYKFFKVAFRAIRPFAFPATIAPVLLGTFIAPHISILMFLLTFFGLILAHSAVNVLSDYFDYIRGADTWRVLGSSRVLVDGLMNPKHHLFFGISLLLLSLIIGFYFVFAIGNKILYFIIPGLILGIFYTAPPVGFKYRALGDLAVFLAFGPIMTLGVYYIQAKEISWLPVVLSIPIGLLTTAILHGNNFRDIKEDLEAGYKTLAGILGIKASSYYYTGLVVLAYLLMAYFIIKGYLPVASVISFITLPIALKNIKISFNQALVNFTFLDLLTAKLQLYFSSLLITGVILGKFLI
ncbi:1,4-dihydroxy-2-naphthoate prenyltransferase [Candidatus Kryptobacter tengchongensis]|nr:1,4-dihydroxy-2-naphthoate prenyltransferase [Candidatus Kryptobacter tengchongensis]